MAVEDTDETYAITDTATQNRVFEEILARGLLDYLRGYSIKKRSPRAGGSVFDYLLYNSEREVLVETKSAVLRGPRGEAMYPDTPTERGRRHVRDLILLSRQHSVMLLFIAALRGVVCFRPNREVDPVVSELIAEAVRRGVVVRALSLYMRGDGTVYLENPDLPLCIE